MNDDLLQFGGVQTVWKQYSVLDLYSEKSGNYTDRTSFTRSGSDISVLNRDFEDLIDFPANPAPAGTPMETSYLQDTVLNYGSLLQEIEGVSQKEQDIAFSVFLDGMSDSINSFANKFNFPTIEFDKKKTRFAEGDISFTISSPVNPYFGTEGTVVCSCGGLTVRKELTADDGVVTTYTYDKSAAYAAAEYTSNGKPVGKCKNGSVTLNLSGSWGSYSGTFQMSNGKISYDDDSTFNALTSLQNVMGGIQQQFGLDQFMVLDTDNILPGYTIDGFLNMNANFVNDTIFSLDNISVPESMFIPAVDLAAMTGFPLESITENAFSLSDYGTFPGAITII